MGSSDVVRVMLGKKSKDMTVANGSGRSFKFRYTLSLYRIKPEYQGRKEIEYYEQEEVGTVQPYQLAKLYIPGRECLSNPLIQMYFEEEKEEGDKEPGHKEEEKEGVPMVGGPGMGIIIKPFRNQVHIVQS